MDRLNFAFAVQPNRIQHDIGMETGGEYARKKSGLSTVLGLIRTFKQVLVGQKLHARHLQKWAALEWNIGYAWNGQPCLQEKCHQEEYETFH